MLGLAIMILQRRTLGRSQKLSRKIETQTWSFVRTSLREFWESWENMPCWDEIPCENECCDAWDWSCDACGPVGPAFDLLQIISETTSTSEEDKQGILK